MSYKINETITFEPNGDNGLTLKSDNHQRLYYNIITVDSIICNNVSDMHDIDINIVGT